MKNHPIYSVQLLEPLGLSSTIINMVKYHHIYYNGSGYPELGDCSLEGGSLESDKIWTSIGYLAMADAFDAMYHQRPYRPPFHLTEIHAEISACIAEQFAPSPVSFILDALINLPMREEFVIC